MKIPFFDGKTKEEKELQKKISQEAGSIARKAMTRTLKTSDIDKLEHLYEIYFKKFPDNERELNSKIRIKKLRTMI